MAIEVTVPAVSENVVEGKVISVLVAEGDTVEQDQSLIELETDKSVVAIPSTAAGVVSSIKVEEGQTVAVGSVILILEGEAPVDRVAKGKAAEEEAALAALEAEGLGTGDEEQANEAKPSAAMPAAKTKAAKPAAAEPASAARPVPAPAAPAPTAAARTPIAAAPSIRRMARRLGVDLSQVRGSGASGRISVEDVENFVSTRLAGGGGSAAPQARPPLPDFSRFGATAREPLSRVRELTAAAMSRAWTTIPMVTQSDESDVTELDEFRREVNRKRGELAPVTVTAILLKVCAQALREFPRFNASLDEGANELVLKSYLNIGVAVDTPHGLLVPVVKNPDKKGLEALAQELGDLAARARERRVTPAELEGANFTISNLGGIGGTGFSPIVNPPEVAILGVSRGARRPHWKDTHFLPRMIMPLSLTYDHRVIDGADGARFLRWICAALEHPLHLLMKGDS